ncbi:MAG: sulfatase [Bacteroidota bacterium]
MKFQFPLALVLVAGCNSLDKKDKTTENDQEGQRPNILFIMSDDHAQKAISAYDSTLIKTPNIDRIANEGALFANSFVANSISSPSRAVMLTGKHSHKNGVKDNRQRFDSSQVTFPKLLKQAGYYTAMIGKWHLKSNPTGFDYWNILNDQGDYYNPDLIEMGDTIHHTGYVTDIITDLTIKTLDNRDKDKPFCLLYHHKAPHRTWMPDTADLRLFEDKEFPLPDNFFDDYEGRKAAKEADMRIKDMFYSWDMKLQPGQYEEESEKGGSGPKHYDFIESMAERWLGRMTPEQRKAWDNYYLPRNNVFTELDLKGKELAKWMYQRYMHDYLKCIVSVDRNIGRVLEYLEENDLMDNTIIVYTSDQGFYLGEHGWYDKRFMYEESFRTPLLIRYPKEIKAGTTIHEMVQNIDYAPTFLNLAGEKITEEIQGRSLRPLWQETDPQWRDALYYHYYEYPHGWHYVNKHDGIRTERHKLIHFYEMGEWELYDLKKDANEMNNLYGNPRYTKLADSLKTELQNLRASYDVGNIEYADSPK